MGVLLPKTILTPLPVELGAGMRGTPRCYVRRKLPLAEKS
jgi:hypothetical protein